MADFIDVLRCNRIELVDPDGVVRLEAFCSSEIGDDSVFLILYAPKRNSSVDLSVSAEGMALQVFHRGNERAAAYMDHDGEFSWSGFGDE